MKKYIRFLLKYRIAILACIIAVTAFFGFYAGTMNTDNSIEIWLSKNDQELDYYKSFLKKFGDEEFLVVAFSTVTVFTRENIREINTIAERLRSLNGVVRVTSLADVFKDKITSPAFKEKINSLHGRSLLKVFKRDLISDPLYKNSIISGNGKTTAIIATVKCLGPESRKQLVSEVRTVLHELADKPANRKDTKRRYYLAGPSVVNAELDRMAKQDMTRFTPIMFVMSILVLGCLFRNISGILIPLSTIGVCITWVMGCYVLSGQTMNMVSNMLLPLTFIIALSTSIHVIRHYYQCREKFPGHTATREASICTTMQHVGIPIVMTSVTTVIGFASLTTSSIPPVFMTGLFMSGCAALTFVISITFIPILLSFIPFSTHVCAEKDREGNTMTVKDGFFPEGLDNKRGFSIILPWLSRFTVRYNGLILLCGLAVGLIFVWGISQLRVESDVMASFPKGSQIARGNAYIERHLTGLLPVEILAETTDGASVLQPNVLNNLITLQKHLHDIPEVTGSLSVANYIQKTHQIIYDGNPRYYTIPGTTREAADYVKLASVYGDKYINNLYAKDQTTARVSVRMKQVGSSRYKAIISSVKEYIFQHLDTTGLSWHITGIVPLLISVQDNILRSEIQSFSLAFLLTFIAMAVALKSIKTGLVSLIPNLLPITITLGLMGFTGIKLDASTIMIASIALGISVDNTIHIFYRFKSELSSDGDNSHAIHRTLQGVGKTAIFTSLSAIFGFMVFSFSSFKPVQYFGVLTSVTMLNAIVSDLLISPSCLLFFKLRMC